VAVCLRDTTDEAHQCLTIIGDLRLEASQNTAATLLVLYCMFPGRFFDDCTSVQTHILWDRWQNPQDVHIMFTFLFMFMLIFTITCLSCELVRSAEVLTSFCMPCVM